MNLAGQAPALAIFIGGCLSGAALLSFVLPAGSPRDQPEQQSDQHSSTAGALEAGVEAVQAAAHNASGDTAVATNIVAAPPLPHEPQAVEPQVGAPGDPASPTDGESAADVLARLEAAYQAQTHLLTQGNTSDAEVESEPANAATQHDPQTAAVPAAPGEPHSEVAAVADTLDEAESETLEDGVVPSEEIHATNVHQGDVHRGDVQGNLHQGNVNQVQQLTLLNIQQVLVVPHPERTPPKSPHPAPAAGLSVGVAASLGQSGIDPWGRVNLSPAHDPWTTTRMSPRHDPWRSSRTVPGNPWGPTFGRRP